MYEQCLSKCATKYQNLIENIDFVICQMCGFHAKSLGVHVNQRHNLTSEAYKKQFPNAQVIADNSHTNYSVVNTENGNWIQRAIENNEDLTEYWAKVSSGVTKSILDNPEERVRRAIVMSKVNQSDIMRQKASETAIKTSARPEILSQRTANLKKWRDENPEDFHNQCIKKMIGSFQSKPEKKLFELVSSLDGFVFKRNQFINSLLVSNKSHNKQMDMGDKAKRIYIEFDGILHFEPRRGIQILEQSKARDREIEQHIINHNWTLIRVSYDQFKYSTKMVGKIKTDASYFKQECLDKLVSILHDGKPGIYKIGEAYE
jgi:very-short-patch-repair endonuclease